MYRLQNWKGKKNTCLLIDVFFFFFSFSIDSLWFPARRCDISGTLLVPLVVFVVLDSLLGVPVALFFRQGTLAWCDAYAWCRFASLFSIAALLKLVFSLFFRLMSPLSKDETGRGCSPVHSCGVVIMDLLVDWCCFCFLFHWFAMVPRPEVRYLWYPCGSLGGFCDYKIVIMLILWPAAAWKGLWTRWGFIFRVVFLSSPFSVELNIVLAGCASHWPAT